MSEQQSVVFTNPSPSAVDVLCESGTQFVQGKPIYVTEDDEWKPGDPWPALPVGAIQGYESAPVVTVVTAPPGATVTLPADTRFIRVRSVMTGTRR